MFLSIPSCLQVSTLGKRRQLASTNINMRKYASVDSTQHTLQIYFKPLTKKITSVVLECTLSSVFIREGKATYVYFHWYLKITV